MKSAILVVITTAIGVTTCTVPAYTLLWISFPASIFHLLAGLHYFIGLFFKDLSSLFWFNLFEGGGIWYHQRLSFGIFSGFSSHHNLFLSFLPPGGLISVFFASSFRYQTNVCPPILCWPLCSFLVVLPFSTYHLNLYINIWDGFSWLQTASV